MSRFFIGTSFARVCFEPVTTGAVRVFLAALWDRAGERRGWRSRRRNARNRVLVRLGQKPPQTPRQTMVFSLTAQ